MSESSEKPLKLEFGGGLFVCNVGTSRKDAEGEAKKKGGFVRKYGVDISTFDPKTGKVINWKEKGGFSVWVLLPKKTDKNGGNKFSSKFTFTK